VAIAPFYRNRYSLGPGLEARCLQLYGPRELQTVFELKQIPMLPGKEAAILRSLLAGLLESPRWDWVELADYGPRTGCWREVLATLPASLRLVVQDVFQVPILPLLSTWEDQRSALRRNVKERIRRGYNSLKRDGLSFKLVIDADVADSDARLAEFHRLHESRAEVRDRKAHVNSFRHPRLRAFLSAVSRRLMEAGILSYAGLEVSGSVVATRMVLQRNGSLYLYYSGFDPAWWSHSVMTVLVTEILKTGISRHLETINFSPGLDQFKSGWTEPDANLTTVAFMIGRQTASSRFRLAAFRRRKRLSATALQQLRRIRDRFGPKTADG
jgi:CelD/BcsL family acetyltransferase involved in cellulose biosynthesis